MNIDIERLKHDRDYWNSVAPEGATHYREKSPCPWLRAEPLSYFRKDQWVDYGTCHWGSYHMADAIPRPAKQWSGDGLPPVGCVAIGNMPSWREERECRVVAHEHNSCVVVYGIGLPESWSTLAWCDTFRPLKSEKDRVVEAAWEVVDRSGILPSPVSERLFSLIAKRLYDAGALKMPEGE